MDYLLREYEEESEISMSWRLNSPKTLVSRWMLNGNTLDGMNRYPGTAVNAPTYAAFFRNKLSCIELNGNNQYLNCGDVAELNAVSQFSIAFWMNQDVLDITDYMFYKYLDGTRYIRIYTALTGGLFTCQIRDGLHTEGNFDYSAIMSAGSWHHVAIAFNGAGVANIDRMKIYVDGIPITLGFAGTVPAATADLSGIDAQIGQPANSFDGKLFDFRIYSVALTNDEILTLMRAPLPVY